MKCPESGVKLVEAPLARKDTLEGILCVPEEPTGGTGADPESCL